jgi:hypothetical protein
MKLANEAQMKHMEYEHKLVVVVLAGEFCRPWEKTLLE